MTVRRAPWLAAGMLRVVAAGGLLLCSVAVYCGGHAARLTLPARDPVTDADVEGVLEDFQREFDNSILRYKFALDTSDSTPQETLERFVEQATRRLTLLDSAEALTVDLLAGE